MKFSIFTKGQIFKFSSKNKMVAGVALKLYLFYFEASTSEVIEFHFKGWFRLRSQ